MKNSLGFELKEITGKHPEIHLIEQGETWPCVISATPKSNEQVKQLFVEASTKLCNVEQFHHLFIDLTFNQNTFEELLERVRTWKDGGTLYVDVQRVGFPQLIGRANREQVDWKTLRNREVMDEVKAIHTKMTAEEEQQHPRETQIEYFRQLIQSAEDSEIETLVSILAETPVMNLCQLSKELVGAITTLVNEDK